MGIQINGNTNNINAGIGSLSIEDINELDIVGVATAANFKTGVSNLHSLGLTLSGGQLDVGSNIKIGTAGVITATSFVGSGANLTGITAGLSNIVEDSSPQLGGDLDVNGKKIKFPDLTGSVNNILYFGTGDDLLIYHHADVNYIQCENARTLRIQYWTGSGNETLANFIPNGEVQLYNNDTRRLRVTSNGITVNATDTSGSEHFGRFYWKTEGGTVRGNFNPLAATFNLLDNSQYTVGNDHDGKFYHDGSNSYLFNSTGNLIIKNDGSSTSEEILIQAKGGENGIRVIANGAAELYYDNVNKLSTTSDGISVTGQLLVGTGSASNRFKNGNGNGATPKFQFETANDDSQNDISLTFGRNNSYAAEIILAKHRAATVGGHTIVQSDDRLGGINFAGSDGTHFRPAALIQGRVDGTPGTSDMPGRLEFLTTADGASTPTERMRIRSDGHVQLQHGLTGLSGGGVIVCAAKSSSGTANQSNYKVDFVVPMGDLGTKKEYEDIGAQFSSGQTGKDYSHARGGSGILIATVQNDYYWGFRTKIYHITTYGNNSNNVTQLNLLHNYSAAGHGANSASVDLTVQSHDGKTPTLRGTFSGDYWNSNILTVTYIGSAVASTGNIRQLTAFDPKLTGQDPTWK